MTWERELFDCLDDLEAQAEGAFAEEREFEILDRARGEYASVGLVERLMASVGGQVGFHLPGVGHLEGRLARVADGWCLLESGGHEWKVRLDAIELARGLSAPPVPPAAWPVTAQLGFGPAGRRVAATGRLCPDRP